MTRPRSKFSLVRRLSPRSRGSRAICTCIALSATFIALLLGTRSGSAQAPGRYPCWLEEYSERQRHTVTSLPVIRPKERFLVFVCDGGCGGVGDRLSGLISSFYLALATERIFLVDHSSPFPLEDTLEPNLVTWNASALLPKGIKTVELYAMDSQEPKNTVRNIVKVAMSTVTVLRIRINRYYLAMLLWDSSRGAHLRHEYAVGMMGERYRKLCGLDAVSPKYTFSMAFTALFKFSGAVEERAMEMFHELQVDPSQDYVAIHARIGGANNSMGTIQWTDPDRHSIIDMQDFITCAKSKASFVFSEHEVNRQTRRSIVLFSDNYLAKTSELVVRENVGTVSSTKLFHVDRSTSSDRTQMAVGNVDTYAELYILSRATCIVGSHSTFSGVAVSAVYPPIECFSMFDSCATNHVDFWNLTEHLPV